MISLSRFIGRPLLCAAMLVFSTARGFGAAAINEQIDPPEANVGDEVSLILTVQNGTLGNVQLPQVDGLKLLPGMSSSSNMTINNGTVTSSTSEGFRLVPVRAGDFTIPAFDVQTSGGEVLHVKAMKLHVLGSGNATAPAAALPNVSSIPIPVPSADSNANANGPVVMPSTNGPGASGGPDAGSPGASGDSIASTFNPPLDKDGSPARVFIVITPQTTDAYVGQSVEMQIDFYIRMDVNWEQNSLPTIKGSDFLMNSFMTRGSMSTSVLANEQYLRETWLTAVSAPKSGDFPLSMERDSYWVKSGGANNLDPFGGGTLGPNLAHELISSNLLTMHVHALPMEGRPDHFTGAIGQFRVTGEAEPDSVAVGEPVTLRFTVSGDGNFDYVRSPALHDDPAWKTYAPKSVTNYEDQSQTQAVKIFEQSVIPQINGNVPLPSASFSYFDSGTKQYVTVPLALPEITVTGSPAVAAAAPDDASAATVGLACLPIAGAILLFCRSRFTPDESMAIRARHRRSLQQEEDVMAEAARRGDALAFFVSARHAVQLQLGARWNAKPEAITLREIRSRDPQRAEALQPLFAQADEVIYSGNGSAGLDLAEWEKRVRSELLQPQPAAP
jgi:hypothetical protein